MFVESEYDPIKIMTVCKRNVMSLPQKSKTSHVLRLCRCSPCWLQCVQNNFCFCISHYSITLPANSPNSTLIVGPWWLTPVFSPEFLVSFLLQSTLRQFGVMKVPVDIRLRTSNVRIKLVSTCRSLPQRDALWKLTGSGWMSSLAKDFIHCINILNTVVVCPFLGS